MTENYLSGQAEKLPRRYVKYSLRSGNTVQMVHVSVKPVPEKLYNHKYYLKSHKALQTIAAEYRLYEPGNKKPRTAELYEQYRNVLPLQNRLMNSNIKRFHTRK